MTRILVTTIPVEGHVRPALPIARHLAAEGHDVAWYTGRKFEPLVTRAGARFLPVKMGLDYDDSNIDVLHDMEDNKPGLAGLKKIVNDLFIAPVPKYAKDIEVIVDDFNPDVVIADHCSMAGPLVAARRGIPKVLFSVGALSVSSKDTAPFGMGLPPSFSTAGRLRNRALGWFASSVLFRNPQRLAVNIMKEMGVDPPPGFLMDWGVQLADRYLLAGIPEFEYPLSDMPEAIEFVGPMLPKGVTDWTPPAWWPDVAQARQAGRPVVLVTQGTSGNTNLSLLIRPAIAALADQDVLVIVATGGPDPAEVMPVARRPANVRMEKFIPFTELLPLTDVMVTNGGYGSVQLSLAHGVPLVVAGMSEDKMEVNARVARTGAGLSLKTNRPSIAKIGAAVSSVLTEESYRRRARELKAAYARYPGASRAAEVVLEAARGQQRVLSRPQGPLTSE